MLDLSVVIPVFNERESLPVLHRRLCEVLKLLGRSYEILFVDDGSTDGSPITLRELAFNDPTVGVVEFRRNIGKSAALSSGFHQAQGRIVITMDADLQDDPEEIPRFLQAIEEGADLVSGWKSPRRDPWNKTFPSQILNGWIRRITGLTLHDINCGYKAYRRPVIESMNLYGEMHRYIPILAHAYGFRIAEIQVKHRPRQYGSSKYDLFQQVTGLLDLVTVLFLTRFQRKPLHLLGWVGISSFGSGLLICGYLTWLKIAQGQLIGQRPLLLLGVFLMLLGVQFLFFGLLAEMFLFFYASPQDHQGYIRSVTRNKDWETVQR